MRTYIAAFTIAMAVSSALDAKVRGRVTVAHYGLWGSAFGWILHIAYLMGQVG